MRAARAAHVQADAVVRASELRDGTIELGWALLSSIARETASIAWEVEQRPSTREAERARSRRIDGLLVIAKLRLEIDRAETGELTPHRLGLLKALLLDTILEVARDTVGVELASEFEGRLKTAWAQVGSSGGR